MRTTCKRNGSGSFATTFAGLFPCEWSGHYMRNLPRDGWPFCCDTTANAKAQEAKAHAQAHPTIRFYPFLSPARVGPGNPLRSSGTRDNHASSSSPPSPRLARCVQAGGTRSQKTRDGPASAGVCPRQPVPARVGR